MAEGTIYDMWDDQENTFDISEMPSLRDMRRYLAVDYGTSNPMVFLDGSFDGHAMWITNEYYYESAKKSGRKQIGNMPTISKRSSAI